MSQQGKSSKRYSQTIETYLTKKYWNKFRPFIKNKETPFLVMDLKIVKKNYTRLQHAMPYAKIYYAVKANPATEIISLLADLGSNFDIASINELDQIMEAGVPPERISFGNTIKKQKDIDYAFQKGLRLFACDSKEELKKIAASAPGSKVFFRLLTEGSGADWPLSKKFGCHPSMIYNLVIMARDMNLVPYGISFHVGSQQRDIGQWDNAISQCKYLFTTLKEEKIYLKNINLGGGLPSRYRVKTQGLKKYAMEITRFLKEDFGDKMPEISIEPGRSLVADAGIIVSEIILISKKSASDMFKWIYLDIGKFNGLIETLDESIQYPIFSERQGKRKEVILAGPTCDSMDILYENFKYKLPENLRIGDRLYINSAGAYTRSYSSVEFNGFPPLKMYILR
jgi:ornithine decarboxylase